MDGCMRRFYGFECACCHYPCVKVWSWATERNSEASFVDVDGLSLRFMKLIK